MKKILILLLFVMVAISVIPEVSYARGYDRAWKQRHHRVWKANEREWRIYEREWAKHHRDRRWRERHIRMWPKWYRWHRENENYLNFRMSTSSQGGSKLEIDLGIFR